MKNLLHLLILLMVFAFSSKASDYPKHMIEISENGLGMGASYERFSPTRGSYGIHWKDFDILKGNVSLNYSHTLNSRLQLGAFIQNHAEERHYEDMQGRKGQIEYKTLLWGLSLVLNFDDDLRNSYYTRLIYSHLNHEEEFSKNVFNYLEDDRNSDTFELALGKRINMTRLKLENLSYSPSVSVFRRTSIKDYEDDGLENSLGINIQVIKFDYLF